MRILQRRFGSVGIFLLALALGLLVSFVLERRSVADRVLRGVVLHCASQRDVPVGGLDREALRVTARRLRTALIERPLTFVIADRRFEAKAGELGVDIDEERFVQTALSRGRSGSWLGQFGWWLGRLFTTDAIDIEPDIDLDILRPLLTEWQHKALPNLPAPPGVTYDGELRAHYPVARTELDVAALQQALPALLREEAPSSFAIPLVHQEPPIDRAEVDRCLREAQHLLEGSIFLQTDDGAQQLELTPKVLGGALESRIVTEPRPALVLGLSPDKLLPALDKVREALEQPASAARFEVDAKHRITIVPSQPGIRLDDAATAQEVLDAATRLGRRGRFVLQEERPALTTEEAESLRIHNLVTQFTTHHPCCEARVKNIHFAASQVDGTVLRPGERFSLNELLGPRTNETGFLDAPTIVRGKMEASPGGGISQFATTLFNAVLDGGYEIIQRQPHTFYFSRYPEGHEATVSYPLPDLVFRNDTNSGLLIKTVYGSTFIRVLLYGDNEGRRVERKLSKRFDLVEPPIEYEPNDRLDPEEEKRKARGHTGWSVDATRIIHYPDGRTVEQRRRVIYKPRPEVLEVHPCKIPKGARGYTGEKCPEPEPEDEGDEESEELETPFEHSPIPESAE